MTPSIPAAPAVRLPATALPGTLDAAVPAADDLLTALPQAPAFAGALQQVVQQLLGERLPQALAEPALPAVPLALPPGMPAPALPAEQVPAAADVALPTRANANANANAGADADADAGAGTPAAATLPDWMAALLLPTGLPLPQPAPAGGPAEAGAHAPQAAKATTHPGAGVPGLVNAAAAAQLRLALPAAGLPAAAAEALAVPDALAAQLPAAAAPAAAAPAGGPTPLPGADARVPVPGASFDPARLAEARELPAAALDAQAGGVGSGGTGDVMAALPSQSGGAAAALQAAMSLHGGSAAVREGGAQAAQATGGAKLRAAPASQPLAELLGERLRFQLAGGGDRAVIRLDPPMLGSVEIVIRHEAGGLQVHLSASHGEVARQLQAIGDSLRQDLVQRQYGDVAVMVVADAGARERDAQGRQGRQSQEQQSPGRALGEGAEARSGFQLTDDKERT
ncbi:flagellar hook-length control protein FliK [Eleftheria terrae]|uniref:flagellar hook-length control protein FliK n=1 Tax=Eleftheria terrae TaxID=1597781 RepID=UPI00263AA308|nr:flagellar hook-length control protein FliK [Eleftheria terrae]WKB54108.1 flagellar hook-length control protein FliK [Eleftheria terrae]